MARERLAEPRVTMERLLAKPRSLLNPPAFLDLYCSKIKSINKCLELAILQASKIKSTNHAWAVGL